MDFEAGRRVWIKRFVLGTAATLTVPQWTGWLLAEVEETLPDEAVIRLNVADYPDLEGVGGSLQLRFNSSTKPFTLNRVSPQEFVTLDSNCTHQGCTVGPYILSEGCMRCPCHGSRYDLEGRVFRDALGSTEPASSDLNRFDTNFDEATGMIAITIPWLALAIRSIQTTPGGAGVRVKLQFPATARSTYEISQRATLDAPWQVASFSLNENGTNPVTSVTPTTSGFLTAYLDASGPSAFFAVGLVLTPA